MACGSVINVAVLLGMFIPTFAPQQSKAVLPMIAGGAVPLYPPLARAAKVEGIVHVKVTTDGVKVVTAQAEDGNRLLADSAEENARTWRFSKHEPTSFTVTYRFRLDANADPNNPTVTLRFPAEVDVSIAPLVLSDPAPEIRK
ncbi:MAG: energy transducer TonB [Bryobacteraceae bacterium]|nr:energy transducer TonB [Bryobacteraceae bacterium]